MATQITNLLLGMLAVEIALFLTAIGNDLKTIIHELRENRRLRHGDRQSDP